MINQTANERSKRHVAEESASLELHRSTILTKQKHDSDMEALAHRARASSIQSDLNDAQFELRKAKEEIDSYRHLLSKPMEEIAKKDGNFKRTYDAQMELMADWMVSQKAFKELAIQFGFEKGQTAKETIQQGLAKEIDVMENKHNPEHNTIVGESEFFKKHGSKLIEKIKKNAE